MEFHILDAIFLHNGEPRPHKDRTAYIQRQQACSGIERMRARRVCLASDRGKCFAGNKQQYKPQSNLHLATVNLPSLITAECSQSKDLFMESSDLVNLSRLYPRILVFFLKYHAPLIKQAQRALELQSTSVRTAVCKSVGKSV